ncbi:MAG: ABC transporter ATP-binding protein [Bryobacteraceae bacterium]|nr:ABC transporter ATP-binding protein [Bryobacteraceae bacterium]MDW8378129.1 ATP-binding cassette domain-containing protein [Bryobacterales bacterium]
MASGEVMIEARGLTKIYGKFVAVEEVSFSVPAGQVCAFLGPNGAGKSTTMKLLTGYLTPTSGSAWIAGINVAEDRMAAAARLGYLPENGPLYLEMTPLGLLRFFGRARGLSGARLEARIADVVKRCALEPVLEKTIRKLSKGYKQRVGMAQVLLHEPDVLIMDEPTTGLDPNQILEVRRTIRELGQSKTILLSTHILQEVEAMADRIVFIHRGRIVYDGTPSSLREEYGSLEHAFHRLTGHLTSTDLVAAGPPVQ